MLSANSIRSAKKIETAMAFKDVFLTSPIPSHWEPTSFSWLPGSYQGWTSSYLNQYAPCPELLMDYARFHALRAHNAGGTMLLAVDRIAYFEPSNALDLVEWLKVGTHGGADAKEVRGMLEMVSRISPLATYFADEAGYRARFASPVSADDARVIAGHIDEMSEGGSLSEQFDLTLPDYIFASQEIQLWWD
jgi:hypothetical protein